MTEWIREQPVPTKILHPAVRCLLKAQAVAKWRKLCRAFSCRRRLVLSIVAVLLTAVWIGNAVLSVMLREATPPERFARIVPIGFLVYAIWHVVKSAFSRPPQAIEFTSAEEEFVGGAPLYRHQLIAYKMAGILNATLLKASCFTLLMLPDLPHPIAGFVGFLLGLVFLDCLRLMVEITAFSLSKSVYQRYRWATGVLLVGTTVSTLVIAFSQPTGWFAHSSYVTLGIAKHLLASAAQLLETPIGAALLIPFQLFGRITVTESLDIAWAGRALLGLTWVIALGALVVRLDGWWASVRAGRERAEYPTTLERDSRSDEATRSERLGTRLSLESTSAWLPWLGGAGPIAWRQWMGARKYGGGLVVAMALPGILALLPVWVCRDGAQAAVQVSAAVIFYSFLLLPTALKFDFRRDITRMVVLKALPVRSMAVVVGQILTPACLAFVFQATVLSIAMLIRPFSPATLLATLLILVPLNFLIFAIDNLVYLLYPYRLNQEGIEIFLRTTLTFTAKGVIFTVGITATFLSSFAAKRIADQLAGMIDPAVVFVVGNGIMLWLATGLTTLLLARVYDRFDPSQDMPL